ncbi:vacuolar iron transporter homolog 2-like [Curcuma longa]|uniref:vacuolar iron transporter homolog 2-like n=1 Tax=Curcuma longa TaxID=136217 RepID=UPI003D9ED206
MAVGENMVSLDAVERQCTPAGVDDDYDYSQRAQWLRAAVLGANDGLLSTASLMMGVGAVKDDAKAMLVSGVAGLVGGACSMAIGEFVSVYSQLDMEIAQLKRQQKSLDGEGLPRPLQAAAASALAFSAGAAVPLVAAGFISSYGVRLGVTAAATSTALMVFGCVGAALGRAPVGKSCLRVALGGWLAMAITFGLMRLFGSRAL